MKGHHIRSYVHELGQIFFVIVVLLVGQADLADGLDGSGPFEPLGGVVVHGRAPWCM